MTEVAALIEEVRDAFVACEIPFYVGGSIASSAWGHPRQTNDADFVALMTFDKIECLAARLEATYLLSRSEIEEAVMSTQPFASFQLLHMEKLWKFDVFVRKSDLYSRQVFARKREIQIVGLVTVDCAGPEDIVIQKLRWYELGNRVSDRQWNDVVQVLEVQKGAIDEAYLDEWAAYFGVKELLDEARQQALD